MTLEFWYNLSVVWIALHLFLLCLVPLGIGLLAVRSMNWILGKVQVGLQRLQKHSARVRVRTDEIATQGTTAVIQGQSKAVRAQVTLRCLLRRTPNE